MSASKHTDRVAYLETQNAWLEKALVAATDCFEESVDVIRRHTLGDIRGATQGLAACTAAMKKRRDELGPRPTVEVSQ